MFETVLVANRGEIAVRVIETCHRHRIKAVAVYSEADAHALHVRLADDAVLLGPGPAAQSYLDIERILEAARMSGAEAIHPGYGFLAESAEMAARCLESGLAWVGASPAAIATMSDKVSARNAVAAAGLPVAPGSATALTELDAAVAEADRLGYPLMLKAVGGGGGLAVAAVDDEAGLRVAFGPVAEHAAGFFGAPGVLLERYQPGGRHIEVQVLGLLDGRTVALGERDCSVQRRHQKLAEEAPAPGLDPPLRDRLARAARRVAELVDLHGVGTVEFLLAPDGEHFVFLEMNTRLQVEHPVTELVTGLDLVEQQLRIAAGEPVSFDPDAPPAVRGHAIEARIYAEDPVTFRTATGKISTWRQPSGPGVRVDAGYAHRDRVPPFYDPLLAKVAAWGADRDEARQRLRRAIAEFRIAGPASNLAFFAELLEAPEFVAGRYDTGLVARLRPPRADGG